MPDVCLIYTSVVSGRDPTFSELASILRAASSNNSKLGVTGVLCYSRGKFMQALEGDRGTVNRLYRKISMDPRHRDCDVLSCHEIRSPRFAEWSMRHVAMELPLDRELDEFSAADAEAYLLECAAYERRTAA